MQQAIAEKQREHEDVIGGWRLERLVAESRWFRIYVAAPASCDDNWPADYALKCIQPALAHDPRPRQLLLRETLISGEISHPHLATVLDADLENDLPYVVQPFYEGANVRSLLRNGALPVARSLWIARQVTEALVAMHGAQWMHGDIKPDNIIVSPQGHVTLVDLGFARRQGLGFVRRRDTLETTLTYAAPELFLPQCEQSPASDIYSLGIMMFEMLTGVTPFGDAQPHQLVRHHLHSDVPEIRRINPLVPADVARLVMQLVVKSPQQRPASDKLLRQIVASEIQFFSLR